MTPSHARTSTRTAAHTLSQTTAQPAPTRQLFIQGLRMVAVVAVFVNHLTGHPRGGFMGVDVFFVISGFLITRLLVRDVRTQTVERYFLNFYRRRVRRIAPAALLVLLSSLIAAYAVFDSARIAQSRSDLLSALDFSANIHLARLGINYFAENRPPSIAQHFWSLAVEEQFYVVWPILILLVAKTLGSRRSGFLTRLFVVVAVLTTASFVYAVHDSSTSALTAYFSTFARAWELGVGAATAVLLAKVPHAARVLGRYRGPLMIVGLLTILVSFFAVDSTSGFPAPRAAVPVLATALVLVAGHDEMPFARLLTNRISVFVGEISYSLYLWHWPTIIIVGTLIPAGTVPYYVTVVGTALALAVFSYEFIETPFRAAQPSQSKGKLRRTSASTVLIAALVLVAVAGYSLKPAPHSNKFEHLSANRAARDALSMTGTHVAEPLPGLTAALVAALRTDSWPSVSPGFGSTSLANELNRQNGTCINPPSFSASSSVCQFGPLASTRRALVIGDSMGTSWLPGIKLALLPRGYVVRGITESNCPFSTASLVVPDRQAQSTSCIHNRHSIQEAVRAFHPTLVVLSDVAAGVERLSDDVRGRAAIVEYSTGQAAAISAAVPHGARTVILAPPVTGADLSTCKTARSVPVDCVTGPTALWRQKQLADERTAAITGASYVDTSWWFCVDGKQCPAFAHGMPVRSDPNHVSNSFASYLAPELARVLVA